MRRVSIENPSVDRTYKTYLDADYSTGTVLTVKSNVSYANNDLIVTGEPTEEVTELKRLTAPTGITTLNLASALNFAHPKTTPIYKVLWDNVSIESKSSAAGTFAQITQSPIQWDSKTNETIYFDPNGTNTYQYRFRFFNSVTGAYSEYSATVTGAVPGRNSVQFMIDNVRKIAGDLNRKIVSDDEIISIFNRAQDIIYSHNTRYFFLYVDTFQLGSGSIPATASGKVYSLANLANYGELAGIKYRYTLGGNDQMYRMKQISEVEFDNINSNLNRSPLDWPTVYKLLPTDPTSANGYFQIVPAVQNGGVGIFYPLYYQKMADLSTVSDTTLVPLPFLLENLAIGYIFRAKGVEAKADMYEEYLIEKVISVRGRAVTIEPKGLKMLDKMDQSRKNAAGQPRSVITFRGQKAMSRLYGNKYSPIQSMDYYRENYF